MRLLKFLNEIVETKIDKEDFYKLLKEKCNKNLQYMKEKKIYFLRGIYDSKDKFLMFDGTKERKSAYTYNYYTILFSKFLDSWKNIPKRDHSLICSTELVKSSSYGTLYLVIPYDDTKIAIANKRDFWDIINKKQILKKHGILDLEDLNYAFKYFKIADNESGIKNFLNTKVLDFYDSNKESVDNIYNLIFLVNLGISYKNKTDNKAIKIKNTDNNLKIDKMVDVYRDILKNVTFYDIFNEILNPENLNINVNKVTEMSKVKSEVWMDKNAILIKVNSTDNFTAILSELLEKI